MATHPETAIAPSEQHSLASLAEQARDYARQSKAANTRRAYRSDWQAFSEWCDRRGRESLPAAPETLCLYLTDQAGALKTSTLQRRITSISVAHQASGFESPTRAAAVRM